MFTILIFSWLTILTGCLVIFGRKYLNLKNEIKYLLPFVQDKTLKALTSYIENDKGSELVFDKNGELLEKKIEINQVESENLFNENFIPLPENCKVNSIEEAISKKIAHKIAQYRYSIDRNKIFTRPNKVCLFWKPGTIFVKYFDSSYSLFILMKNNKCQWLYDSNKERTIGAETREEFANLYDSNIELLALPEEYLK